MKHPPKPFAVEIKRSRRSPMPSPPSHTDFLGKVRTEPGEGASPALFGKGAASSKAEFVSKSSPDEEFAIPAFLRSDKPERRTAPESLSKEAEQVFAPKAQRPVDDRQVSNDRARRILPSLISPESLISDADSIRIENVERQAHVKRPRQSRKRKDAATDVAQTQARTGRLKDNGATLKSSSKIKAVAAQANQVKAKPKVAKRPDPAPKVTAPAAPRVEAFETIAVLHGLNSRGARVRRGMWRGPRDEIAALPPGQHWKRRLNPRAW